MAQVSATMTSGALLSRACMSCLGSCSSWSSPRSSSPALVASSACPPARPLSTSGTCGPAPYYLAPSPGTPETEWWRCLSSTSSCRPLRLLLFFSTSLALLFSWSALTLPPLPLLPVLPLMLLAFLFLRPWSSPYGFWECGRLRPVVVPGKEHAAPVRCSTVPSSGAPPALDWLVCGSCHRPCSYCPAPLACPRSRARPAPPARPRSRASPAPPARP